MYQKIEKQRTDYVEDAEELAEEVSVRPEVVVLQVGVEIIDQQLLLLSLLRFSEEKNNLIVLVLISSHEMIP